jgi:hypothetical protein
MSKSLRKIVSVVVGFLVAVSLVGPGVAYSQTAEELQAQIEALLAQLAELQAQLAALQEEEIEEEEIIEEEMVGCPCEFTRYLYPGMRGDDVKCLQEYLNDSGFILAESGPGSPGNETTYFGPLTRAAVKAWQDANGVEYGQWWGYFGPKSQAVYEEICVEEEEWEEEEVIEEEEEGLTVALAEDTPAAAYYLRDTGGVIAQVRADFVKFVFTNGDPEDVTVTTLKLKRTGISSDSDLSNVYLYEGETQIAEYTSFTSQIVTFSNTNGLFTIPAGESKEITVKADITAGTATVTSIIFGIESPDYIESNASSVNGDFPLRGNAMAVATVTDLGYLNITNYTTYPSTIDPGVTDYELWRFSVTASDQDMAIEKIVMTLVGTVDNEDIQNLKLEVGGVAISDTVNIDENNKVVFDLSASPYTITKGQTKIIILRGDVPKGTGRSFKFTIREVEDFIVKDTHYGVYTSPLVGGSAFAVVQPTTGAGTSINTGSLTVSVCSDSPSGNVAAGATNVSLAKFCFKANGEDIKITNLSITVNEETGDSNLDNGKLYYNGSQVGTTDTVVNDETANVFNLAVIIPAGETGIFEYRADITTGGSALAAGETIVVSLNAATTYAIGQSSLQYISIAAATGRTLTVASGALSVAKNNAMADYTASYPTGVRGATGVKVASFVITAGAGEGVSITQIVIGDDGNDTTYDFGDNFQNLKLMHEGSQIGSTLGTLSGASGADYTFNISPAISLGAGEQYVVDVYADILSGATGYPSTAAGTAAAVGLEVVSVTATGVDTGQDVSWTTGNVDLHKLVIVTSGSLTITALPSPSTPIAGQLVMGDTENTFATFQFVAGAAEDIQVTRIEISHSQTNFAGSLSNIKLIDAETGAQVGPTVASFDANNDAEFNFATPWIIPAGSTKLLVLKADVNDYPNAVSGSPHTLTIASAADIDSLGVSSGIAISETVSGATSNPQDVYRTKVTVAKNAASPSGSAVAGANSEVLRVDVTADANYSATLSTVALSISGSVDTTGNGSAYLYDASDLATSLKTEAYKAVTVSGGSTTTATSTTGAFDGIPVGATIRIYDTSAAAYFAGSFTVVSVVDDGTTATLTFTPAASAAVAVNDIVYYRPLQPGSGKLYFGAHTTLTADVANGATTLSVSSINGFATGDTITIKGYDANGNLLTATGTIKSLSGTTITLDSGVTLTATIDYDYLDTASNALAHKHTSRAIEVPS